MQPYCELRAITHYSFLRGASHPKELIDQAVKLGLPGIGIADFNGVYGLPKAYLAAQDYPGFKLISGAQIKIVFASPALTSGDKPRELFLTLLAQTRKGYGRLCRLLTQAHHGKPKVEASLSWSEFIRFLEVYGSLDLVILPELNSLWDWKLLREIFDQRVYIPLSRFLDQRDLQRTQLALDMGRKNGIEIVATNDVHYHWLQRSRLQDVLSSIRAGVTLNSSGYHLFSNQERYLKSPDQMEKLFVDLPMALKNTLKIADGCTFSLSELRYRYPSEWIPENQTAQSYLENLVWKGALGRYSNQIPENVKDKIKYELKLIHELNFENYFLTIWEIVEFARFKGILSQGRGSAANSVVCYVLGITAIDPVRMDLLFERFISAERGEPPDIDIDFEHERREEVIQHIYEKYGRDRAAMVSAVITYRSRSAIREVTRVFGNEMEKRDFLKILAEPNLSSETLIQEECINELKGFPRHLSIHSGGFTLSADPMVEIVPIEPARMEGRTIVQWDKYDLDALGLLKVDLLSLGMLTAVRKTLQFINRPGGVQGLTLATVPPEDPETYEMMCRADTIGTFQIESRAQMAMLPRLLPRTFYDLVVQVALVRPGPIQGNMVHPYLKRRKGLEAVSLPDSRLKPILERTLGVPIFQEQVMKMAILLADFTPGEADQLRKAIGAWRSSGSIDVMGKRLMAGLLKNGIPQDFADRIFAQIQGFSEYGFPESHAASFALIAYASAYLKCHYPAEFTCGLLNSQPLGFYAPHTLIDDAKRHGVKVYPLHPNRSGWDCSLEEGGIRIGFRYLKGFSKKEADHLLKERQGAPFQSLSDFLNRCDLRKNMVFSLALGDTFRCFGLDQRAALWQILAYFLLNQGQLNLFSQVPFSASDHSPFPVMNLFQSIQSDYKSFGLSSCGHPMQVVRAQYPKLSRLTAAMVKAKPHGEKVQVIGLSIVIQRPPTAKGTAFATLEDETGFLDLIFHRDIFQMFKECILDHCFLLVFGKIQRDGLSVSLLVQKVSPFL